MSAATIDSMTTDLMAHSDYSEKWPVTPAGGASLSRMTRSVHPDGGNVWRRCGR
jgi:hypothetical protein